MPEQPLFTATELGDWVQADIPAGTAALRERVVWGWLKPILKLEERPEQPSEQLFAWAIELGGIAHENPSGKSAYQLGDENSQYSAERRREILDEVAAGGISSATPPQPRGRFPKAQRYPDPACW